jgi:hypothetical protein
MHIGYSGWVIWGPHIASPGYGMEIACVLGKASQDIIKKVEKSLRRKSKKRVVSWKLPRLLD